MLTWYNSIRMTRITTRANNNINHKEMTRWLFAQITLIGSSDFDDKIYIKKIFHALYMQNSLPCWLLMKKGKGCVGTEEASLDRRFESSWPGLALSLPSVSQEYTWQRNKHYILGFLLICPFRRGVSRFCMSVGKLGCQDTCPPNQNDVLRIGPRVRPCVWFDDTYPQNNDISWV